jgi:hypothetical protein
LGGHTKHRRWADDDGEESDDEHPTTYLEVPSSSAEASFYVLLVRPASFSHGSGPWWSGR